MRRLGIPQGIALTKITPPSNPARLCWCPLFVSDGNYGIAGKLAGNTMVAAPGFQ